MGILRNLSVRKSLLVASLSKTKLALEHWNAWSQYTGLLTRRWERREEERTDKGERGKEGGKAGTKRGEESRERVKEEKREKDMWETEKRGREREEKCLVF